MSWVFQCGCCHPLPASTPWVTSLDSVAWVPSFLLNNLPWSFPHPHSNRPIPARKPFLGPLILINLYQQKSSGLPKGFFQIRDLWRTLFHFIIHESAKASWKVWMMCLNVVFNLKTRREIIKESGSFNEAGKVRLSHSKWLKTAHLFLLWN